MVPSEHICCYSTTVTIVESDTRYGLIRLKCCEMFERIISIRTNKNWRNLLTLSVPLDPGGRSRSIWEDMLTKESKLADYSYHSKRMRDDNRHRITNHEYVVNTSCMSLCRLRLFWDHRPWDFPYVT